ncbi:glycine cleavage system protein GcvH [bacterium]|jgi:glycine cleavage system H protein|nr:glycine cleavage system protein GcvH [bacterium]
MNLDSLKYAATHEWIDAQGDAGTVGITRFAVDQLTDLVFVELPAVGKKLSAGAPFGVVESVKAVSDIYAPVAGEVIAINDAVVREPALLSEDPYEKGWLIKLRLDNASDVGRLMSKGDYEASCHSH